ncbi:MAG: NADH:flavin oxidoreductase [Desulfomonile tiedjei]|uniref:NADH:flavin oxidoreductase n=1 Tax=Desulfomonile tiedjei TaxID=2358 RepID=A0A9D6Z4E9_9BACT|nr:NADH:flavin oxidoreductase [Desulfomonile tiedjei]
MSLHFEKTSIKSLELSNRSVRSATWTGLGDEKGYVTDQAVSFYGELGSGEIGLIVTGYQYVMTNGIQLPYMIGNYEDGQIDGLSRLAEIVHNRGGRIIPQIVHAGARANVKLFREGDEVWGPSAIADPVTGKKPKEVSRSEIHQLLEAYAAAALRSKKAGFDGVQLHAAHGYGINQFLSPVWNKRSDSYGGSISNRYRFLAEVLEAVRAAVGEDFPVVIKLAAHDFVENGLVPEEAVQVSRRLADDGIDAIEVSAGSAASPKDLAPIRKVKKVPEDEGYFLEFASYVKESVEVPVIAVGGFRSLGTVQAALSDGKADYTAMSRPFIREPHLIKRWKNGDTSPALCISCGGCFETGLEGKGISCKIERQLKKKQEKKQR